MENDGEHDEGIFGCATRPEEGLDSFWEPPISPWNRPDNCQTVALLAAVAVVGVVSLAFGILAKK